jgi:hypothetical protein
MSLTLCRECKHEVSSGAKVCPNCGAANPGLPIGTVATFFLGLAIVAAIVWWPFKSKDDDQPAKPQLTLAERFPGHWRLDGNGTINMVLATHKIRGCGEYRYRQSAQTRDEYLVYCTRDGKEWTPYVVRADLDEIWGPYTLDPSVPADAP